MAHWYKDFPKASLAPSFIYFSEVDLAQVLFKDPPCWVIISRTMECTSLTMLEKNIKHTKGLFMKQVLFQFDAIPSMKKNKGFTTHSLNPRHPSHLSTTLPMNPLCVFSPTTLTSVMSSVEQSAQTVSSFLPKCMTTVILSHPNPSIRTYLETLVTFLNMIMETPMMAMMMAMMMVRERNRSLQCPHLQHNQDHHQSQ